MRHVGDGSAADKAIALKAMRTVIAKAAAASGGMDTYFRIILALASNQCLVVVAKVNTNSRHNIG